MREITYQLIRSTRKTISIQITPTGEITVRCPKRCSAGEVDAFVRSKRGWIEAHLAKMAETPRLPTLSPEEVQTLAVQAKTIIAQRVAHFAPIVGVNYGRITIRSQHTRWGSCSAKGNLNFNCLLMLCPAEVVDYVVVHELCHRLELNHSAKFWAQVARVMPEYPKHKKWLKENGSALIRRLPNG